MAKDIQIKYMNELQEWEELYPSTKARIVSTESGQSVENVLTSKSNKAETYTKTEVDGLLSSLNEFDIPVQETEPTDHKIWFEVL